MIYIKRYWPKLILMLSYLIVLPSSSTSSTPKMKASACGTLPLLIVSPSLTLTIPEKAQCSGSLTKATRLYGGLNIFMWLRLRQGCRMRNSK